MGRKRLEAKQTSFTGEAREGSENAFSAVRRLAIAGCPQQWTEDLAKDYGGMTAERQAISIICVELHLARGGLVVFASDFGSSEPFALLMRCLVV